MLRRIRSPIIICGFLVALAAVFLAPGTWADPGPDGQSEVPPTPKQMAALDELERRVGRQLRAGFDPRNGTPSSLLARGSFLSGPARFGPGDQSVEAALLSEVNKLLASDAQAGDWFGGSVAVRGETALVGART